MVYFAMGKAKTSSMPLGVGIDIISIGSVKDAVETAGKAFLNKVFTPQELQQAEMHPNPMSYLAARFAGKEAIFKTFAIGWEISVQLKEIEISDGESGEPVPLLRGMFAKLASQRGATKVLLSLSYDGEYAVAMAVLL